MITFKLNGVGDEITYNEDSMTYPEGLELERQTGMGSNKFLVEQSAGTTKSTAAMLWLGVVNDAAARAGISFRDAARQQPFDQFTETLDVMASMRSSRRVDTTAAPAGDEAEDPTAPGTGATEPMSPDTSEPQPSETPSPEPASTTSDSSLTTSTSDPGSGTSSPSPTSAS